MKTVQFTNIHLEHFGKHENIQSKLGHRTVIEGANATGKSTIKRAIQYILGTKDESGKEISGIRPHDENGVDIDGLTTVAELTVSVDGAENTLKRTCFQEKSRQGEYTGKDNLQYFVDDVKKGTKKAYDEFVQTVIPEAVCISAQELLMKDTAGRRAMLEVFSKHDTDGIITENPDFEPLRGKLNANTIADLKKACRDKIKEKTKERDAYPVQISVIENQKVNIDLAELELHRNLLNEQIAENKAKQANVDKQFADFDKLSDGIMELKFELSDLRRKANEELFKQRNDLRSQIDGNNEYLFDISNSIQKNNREIAGYEQDIESGEKERKRLLDQWNKVNAEVFDENTAICPTCHRELPREERESLLSAFEKSKAERIAEIERKGLAVKDSIKNAKEMIPKLQECNKDNLTNKEKLEKEVADLEKQLSELPESIDISDREDVKEINRQIAEKEAAMQKGNSASETRQQLQAEYEDLQRQLNEVEVKFLEVKKNEEKDNHIAELRKKQREISQEIADIGKELALLKDFERKKAELLEADVNENFDLVQFRMFEQQQNGDLKDVCQILVGGEDYSRNLNFSNRLLADVDICRGFQRNYDVELPILIDNAESIDKDRIPNVSNQLILFQRADCKELKIECLEG